MIDIHSHFLPGIDDGADSEECAIQMLEDLKQQGVNTVVSTSHYYAHNGSIDKFLQDRENSYSKLIHRLDESREMYPDIILGAEVALTPELSKNEDLGKLCIGDSNAILIELPYNGFYEWIPYAVYDIISKRNLVPILAHFERFCVNKKEFEKYKSLLSLEVKIQVNTESLLGGQPYRIVKQLVKMDSVDAIGSDAHNMTTRKSTFSKGVKRIEKKFGIEYLEKLNDNAKKLIGLT